MENFSDPEVFYIKDVLRNFAKFTGKHPCQSLFFGEVAGLRPTTLLKKETKTPPVAATAELFMQIYELVLELLSKKQIFSKLRMGK